MAALSTLALASIAGAKAIGDFTGQRKQAKIAEQEGNYASAAYSQNAGLAEQQAADAIARGVESESRFRTEVKGAVGSSRASQAAQGIDVGAGSAVDVQHDIAAVGELDALTIRNNAAREAWGYQTQATQYRSAAEYARVSGRNQAKALRTASLGSLLTGASQIAGLDWSRGAKKPPGGGDYGTSTYGRRGMGG